jgi:CubicO group peptidase (beta-lactamase class C family)
MRPSPDERVALLLDRCRRAGRFPGAAAVWTSDGVDEPTVVCTGSSRVAAPARCPAGSDTVWDLASLTKPLVIATLVLLMARERAWDLDAPLRTVLDPASRSPVGERSLRSLLAHSSGLPAWRPVYALASGRPEEALDAVLGIPLAHREDERVEYSCLGYLLLGWALEWSAGMPLDELFRVRVSVPLGLDTQLSFGAASFEHHRVAGAAMSPTVERRLTAEWGSDPATVPDMPPLRPDDGNARFLGGVAGNAGLFGTGPAAVRLAAEYLPGGGSLLTASEADTAARRAVPGATGQHRSLGWQIATSPQSSAGPALDPAAFGHTGFTGVSIWIDPVRRKVMGLFAHRHHPAHRGIDLHPVRRRFHALVIR